MSTSPSFSRIAKNNMKSSDNTVEDNKSLPKITTLKGLSLPRAPCTPVLHIEAGGLGASEAKSGAK